MQLDLLHDHPKNLFFRYLVPSVGATMVTSIYLLADSIMIGKGLGDVAIAALNLLLPIFNILFGTGALFGVGGGVLFSVAMGNQDPTRAKKYFSLALLLNTGFMLFYLASGIFFLEPILTFLGATPVTMPDAYEYAFWVLFGVPCFTFSTFLQAVVRNDKNPNLAMVAVMTGGILNIILDWIFIFPFQWGMAGASIASVIGSSTACLILCTHFFRKNCNLKFSLHAIRPRYIREIFGYGFSSFFMEISNGLIIFVFNLQALRYAGEVGVTVYSILSNTAYMVTSLSNGIAQAAQPLMAINFGAGYTDRIKKFRKYGLVTESVEGLGFALVGLLLPLAVIYAFLNPSETVLEMAPNAVRFYFISFLFLPLNIFFINYFQAILKPKQAMTVCILRGLALGVSFALILPVFFDITGLWLAMPFAEVLTLLIAFLMKQKTKINLHNPESRSF